ncbi:MAG: pyridoxamine 5'-phosphate oxidase family protein, partial [Saprospiraceae bacterium]
KAWFPEGIDSPRLALVEVKAISAVYWDSSSSKIVQLFNMGRAILTGQRHSKVSSSEHATVEL